MMSNVQAIKTSKIHSLLQNLSKEFMGSPKNELYCNLCSCAVSSNKRFLVESHRNTIAYVKHQKVFGSKPELAY